MEMIYTNYSGGADGSDTFFDLEGEKYGVKTVAYSFYGHNIKQTKSRFVLTTNQLDEGFEHVKIANKTIKRNISVSSYVKKLLSRNWYQVKNADCIFAIGKLKPDGTVDGGTGWAVQMAIDNKKPIFLFEQNKNCWYEYTEATGDLENDRFAEPAKFRKIDYIPTLTENFAGIGTRDLNENGKNAIIELYKVNFNEP